MLKLTSIKSLNNLINLPLIHDVTISHCRYDHVEGKFTSVKIHADGPAEEAMFHITNEIGLAFLGNPWEFTTHHDHSKSTSICKSFKGIFEECPITLIVTESEVKDEEEAPATNKGQEEYILLYDTTTLPMCSRSQNKINE